MTAAAVALSALFRVWLGGTPRLGPTWLKYLLGLSLAFVAVWLTQHDAARAGVAAVGYLAVWRIYGHAPMLQVPLYADAGRDWVYDHMGDIRTAELGWWLYAGCRYVVPCELLGEALGRPWPMLYAGVAICAGYRLTYAARTWLPYAPARWLADLAPEPDYTDSCQPYFWGNAVAGAALMMGLCA